MTKGHSSDQGDGSDLCFWKAVFIEWKKLSDAEVIPILDHIQSQDSSPWPPQGPVAQG